MVLVVVVVVSISGIYEPKIAKPNGNGLAVPKIKDVPARAIALWVIDINPINIAFLYIYLCADLFMVVYC